MISGAWGEQKVREFRELYLAFEQNVFINSKETGGLTCLGENLYGSQIRLFDGICDGLKEDVHDFKVLKSRQLGITTRARSIGLFWLGLFDGMKGAMVFDTGPNKENARREIEMMIENLPGSVDFPRIKSFNRDLMILTNQSSLQFMNAGVKKSGNTRALGASLGINMLLASEMASWVDQAGITSLKQSLAKTYENRLMLWESPLALDTPIPTPSGWTTMGEIKAGDQLFDDWGNVCHVVGVSPVFIGRDCYEIEFSNGDKIVADAVHKWQVEERIGGKWHTKIVPTTELTQPNLRIVVGHQIQTPSAELPIDPYVLGLWLGDGKTTEPQICGADEDLNEIHAEVLARGYKTGGVRKYGNRVGVFTLLGQRDTFKSLGLLGNKHIPEVYLRASAAQRRDLLAGLMDTDGHISAANFRAEFASTSPKLVDGVSELLASLGIKHTRSSMSEEGKLRKFPGGYTSSCQASERLRFSEHPAFKVFQLTRKRNIQNSSRDFTWRKAKCLQIVSVKPTKSVPVRCIEVSSPTHLFLAGRTMVPTHNTARGPGVWKNMWDDARRDDSQRCIFAGWWSHPLQRIDEGDRRYYKYTAQPPSDLELEKMEKVRALYGVEITKEQLAWYRWLVDPTAERSDDEPEDADLLGEQPWHEGEAFQMAGSTFFAPDVLGAHLEKVSKCKPTSVWKYFPGTDFLTTEFYPARTKRDVHLKVWEDPVEGASYVVSADPAFGHNEENNNSACEVLRCYADGVDQVAEFASASTPTHQFAWLIAALMGWYGMQGRNAVVPIIEINGPGESVWREIKQLKAVVTNGYLRMEAKEKGLQNIFGNVRDYIYARSDSYTPTNSTMWLTSGQRKVTIMERLRDLVHTQTIVLRSVDVLEEMQGITRSGDSIGSEGRDRDDRVYALAMGVRAWEDSLRRALVAQNRTREADKARLSLSPEARYNLFTRSQLDMFFKTKHKVRVQQRMQQARAMWRFR